MVAFAQLVEAVPSLGLLVLVGVSTLLLDPVLIALALARRTRVRHELSPPPRHGLELAAVVLLAAPLLAAAVVQHQALTYLVPEPQVAREQLVTDFVLGLRVALSASTVSALINIPNGLMLAGVLGLLASTRVPGLSAAPRAPEAQLPRWAGAGAALGALAVVLVSASGLGHVLRLNRLLGAVASASPDHKMSALRDGLQAALPILYAGIAVAVLALATGLVLGGLALVRARLQVKRPGPAAVFVGVALVLSALLIADAMPLAKEVSRPPPFSPRALFLPASLPVTTPDFEGALAEVPRGLVIVVGPQILQVEAAPIEGLHALPDRIRQAKQVEAMRSSARRPFSALLAVDRDTPVERVLEVIGVVGPAVDQLVLAFVHDEPQRARPIFGQRTLRTETWLRLSMTPGEPSVQVRAKERFQSLAERSIEAAGGGGAVHWRVSEEPPPGLEGRGAAAGHLRDTHP